MSFLWHSSQVVSDVYHGTVRTTCFTLFWFTFSILLSFNSRIWKKQYKVSHSCMNSVLVFVCLYPDFVPISPTGVDFKIKTVELRGKKIRLQIWWVNWTALYSFTACCTSTVFPITLQTALRTHLYCVDTSSVETMEHACFLTRWHYNSLSHRTIHKRYNTIKVYIFSMFDLSCHNQGVNCTLFQKQMVVYTLNTRTRRPL